MAILLLFILIWWVEQHIEIPSVEEKPKSKLKVYDMPDDLFVNGAYQVGDEFKL